MELTQQNQYTTKRAACVGVLFVGAVAARIFWVNQVRTLWGDEPFSTWLSGGTFSAPTPTALQNVSLFPTLAEWIARLFQSIGANSSAAVSVSTVLMYVLFGGLLVAPVYGIARRMGGEAIAAGAGLATVFYPAMLGSLPQAGAMVEPMYLLLVAAAWYFLLVAIDEGSLWPAGLGGLRVGLAYLTRPAALIYLVFALGLLLVATWLSRKNRFGLRRAAANVGIALGVFALIAGPSLAALFRVRM
jgi:4-amino-4-deoxy-L-arabinose transferase-like glycosyltransferase